MSSSPMPRSSNLHLLKILLPLSLSLTNAHILHLNRLLCSTARLDALLSTLHYTLKLLSTLPSHTALAALAALLSRVRTTLRLTGLVGIWTSALSLRAAPPRDRLLHVLAWAQTGAGAVYQGLENAALLAETGVWRPQRVQVGRLWRWSSQAWMVWVGLEAGRLGREWVLEEGRGKEGEGEGEEKSYREARRNKWWRQAVVAGAFLPLTLHWSFDRGVLGERWIGALGLVAGGMALEQAWRETA